MNAIPSGVLAARKPAGTRLLTDRNVFVATAALLVVLTLAGFIPSSIEKVGAVQGGQRPPFPVVLHVHAVVMGLWLMLLLTQSTLAASGRRTLHRTLGMGGMVLLAVILVTGVLLIGATWQPLWGPGSEAAMPAAELQDTRAFVSNILLMQIRGLVTFPIFIIWALMLRRSDPDSHRRLMLLGTAIPVLAGLDRLSASLGLTLMPASPLAMEAWLLASVLPLLLLDWRQRRLHFTTSAWLAVNAVMAVAVNLLWNTAWWQQTAPRLVGVA